jgi:chemotaxis response regulator CheB
MKICLFENNIYIKKTIQDFCLREREASLGKVVTIPMDLVRLKREIQEITPNLIILNLDNYRSSEKELEDYLSTETFKFTSIIFTSKEQKKLDRVTIQSTKVVLQEYGGGGIENEIEKFRGILTDKLTTYNKIKSRIKTVVREREREAVEERTFKTINAISKNHGDEFRRNSISLSNNPELDEILPKHTSLVNKKVIAIGSSIGGVEVIEKIIKLLPENKRIAPIIITQHISAKFGRNLVDRLNKIRNDYNVQMGSNNKLLIDNNIYIAPGDKHMGITRNGTNPVIKVFEEDYLVSKHKPSIDVLFRSVANTIGRNALGIILTGMGKDGVKGMGEVFDSGAMTLAQEKKTCTVQGIAGECIVKGYIKKEISIEEIVDHIAKF